MNRVKFTGGICRLILRMREEGEIPLLDSVKRSAGEQNDLFLAGKSKCDGYKKLSQHQRGKAADIYFIDKNDPSRLAPPINGYAYWHQVWESTGGSKVINWDQGHFEG